MTDFRPYLDALDYAIRQHGGAMRKNGRRLFVTHPIHTAELLREAGVSDTVMLQAALLHDVLEDTEAKYEDLRERFGADLADLVVEVSDDVRLPRAQRRAHQLDAARTVSPKARAIKLADMLSNLRDLEHAPPTAWNPSRLASYRAHCRALVQALIEAGGGPATLEAQLRSLLEDEPA